MDVEVPSVMGKHEVGELFLVAQPLKISVMEVFCLQKHTSKFPREGILS